MTYIKEKESLLMSLEAVREEAFQAYFTFRNESTKQHALEKTAKQVGKSYGLMRQWFRKYEWHKRASEKSNQILERVDERVADLVSDQVKSIMNGLKNGIDDFFARVEKGEIKITNYKEVTDCINVWIKLCNLANPLPDSDKGGKVSVFNIISNVQRANTESIDKNDRLVIDVSANSEADPST